MCGKKQNYATWSKISSELIKRWVNELLNKVKDEFPEEMPVSGQGRELKGLQVSDKQYQRQRIKSIENTEETWIAQGRFGGIYTPARNGKSTNSEFGCYDLWGERGGKGWGVGKTEGGRKRKFKRKFVIGTRIRALLFLF